MTIENFLYPYISQEEDYEKGAVIIKEGSRGKWAYLILDGTVKVKKRTPKGVVTIDSLTEGDIFGEMILWLSAEGTRTASVIADTNVRLGVLDTELFMKEYESISPRLKSLIGSLIQRLASTTQRAVKLAIDK